MNQDVEANQSASKMFIPIITTYKCCRCGRTHIRLWRFEAQLFCFTCAIDLLGLNGISEFGPLDMIGPFQPAITTKDSVAFFAFGHASLEAIDKWLLLPLYI